MIEIKAIGQKATPKAIAQKSSRSRSSPLARIIAPTNPLAMMIPMSQIMANTNRMLVIIKSLPNAYQVTGKFVIISLNEVYDRDTTGQIFFRAREL